MAIWSFGLASLCLACECVGIIGSFMLKPQMMLVPKVWSAGGSLTVVMWMAAVILGVWGWRRSFVSGGERFAMLGLGTSLVNLLVGFLWLVVSAVAAKAEMTKTLSASRQITVAIKAYAADHNGQYPDAAIKHPLNSNEVLRKLFAEGYLEAKDERVFGSAFSSHRPDGVVGEAPDFREALKAGENHWAMTKGLTESSPAQMPLIYESPAVATWPPKWDADAVMVAKPGRVWLIKRVVVGFNDGSVNVMRLAAHQGAAVGLALKADGSPVFPDVHPTPEILDVAK